MSDPLIQQEVDNFPQEAHSILDVAGGIGHFLIQSLEFAMIDDFVCLMQDAVKARHLADKRKKSKDVGNSNILNSPRTRGGKSKALSYTNHSSPSQYPTLAESLAETMIRRNSKEFDVLSRCSSDTTSTSRVDSPTPSQTSSLGSSLTGAQLNLMSITSNFAMHTTNVATVSSADSFLVNSTDTVLTNCSDRTSMSPKQTPSLKDVINNNSNKLSGDSSSQDTNSDLDDLTNFPSFHDANYDTMPASKSMSGFTSPVAMATQEELSGSSDLDESVARETAMVAEGVAQEAAYDSREEFRKYVQAAVSGDIKLDHENNNKKEVPSVYNTQKNEMLKFNLSGFGNPPPGFGDQKQEAVWPKVSATHIEGSHSTPDKPTPHVFTAVSGSLVDSPNKPIVAWSHASVEKSELFSSWAEKSEKSGKDDWLRWNLPPTSQQNDYGDDLTAAADGDESALHNNAEVLLPSHSVISSSISSASPIGDQNRQSPMTSSPADKETIPKSSMLDDIDDDDDDDDNNKNDNTSSSVSNNFPSMSVFTQMPNTSGSSPWGQNNALSSFISNSAKDLKPNVWTTSSALTDNLSDLVDDEFTKEISLDVHNQLIQHSAFRDNPHLLKDIVSDVHKDIETCKHSPNVEIPHLVDVCVNTDIDIYKTMLGDAELKLKAASDLYQEALDKVTQVQNTSGIEIRALKKQLQDLTENYKVNTLFPLKEWNMFKIFSCHLIRICFRSDKHPHLDWSI